MKTRLVLPLLLLSLFTEFSFPGYSQGEVGTVKGLLLDGKSQKPLRGVSVRLIGSETETKSDIQGAFSLTVPVGSYAGLVVNLPMGAGLSLLEAEVRVEPGAEIDLESLEMHPPMAGVPQGNPALPGLDSGSSSAEPSDTPSLPDRVRYLPWLGVLPQEVPADYGPQGGSGVAVSVERVFRGSPADEAGFQPGDFIDHIGENPVNGILEFLQLIAASRSDAPIEVTVDRRGEMLTLKPWLVPVPEAALMAILELASEGMTPPAGTPDTGGTEPPPAFGPPSGQSPPLLEEARRQTSRGNFPAADRAYEEYLASNPQDGLVWAEYAEMVFHNIQNARGMQLMAQAVKKPGLPPIEKTRLRLIIAQRRLESGSLATAQQMLIEAKREDPFNPVIDDLLQTIEFIILQASGQVPGPPQAVPSNQPGGQVDANQVLLNELLGKIAKELAKD